MSKSLKPMAHRFLPLSQATQEWEKKVTHAWRKRAIELVLFLAAFSSVATTIAIMVILVTESLARFKDVSIVEFLTSKDWAPLFDPPRYGILPLIAGTFVTSAVALTVAIPAGTIVAVHLYAQPVGFCGNHHCLCFNGLQPVSPDFKHGRVSNEAISLAGRLSVHQNAIARYRTLYRYCNSFSNSHSVLAALQQEVRNRVSQPTLQGCARSKVAS